MTAPLSELRQVIWLTEMAAVGCVHENRSAWASQLRQDAAQLRRRLEREEREVSRRMVGR